MQIRVLALFLLCYSPVQALESSTSSPALPSQTATITTLPPAQPSSNSTNPCDFTNRSALLDRVVSDWQGYNISLLVEKCPHICVLIYGDGNPDVSGIGVLVSYIVQFVSTVLVGPALLYIFAFESRYSDGFNQFLSMVINDVRPDINSGNDWIMFSVMVASVIRLSQDPPVFEMDFISTLLWFQWLMALARAVTTRVLTGTGGLDEGHGRGARSMLFTFLALIFTFIVSMSAGYPAGAAQSKALVAITHFCAFGNDLPVPLYVDTAEGEKSQLPWWHDLLLRFAAPLLGMGLIAIVAIVGSILVFVCGEFFGLWAEITGSLWAKLPNGLKKQLTNLGLLTLSALAMLLLLLPGALWLIPCVWLLTVMQDARNTLQMALGKQYQDSYWGFGQVTIVVMLLPSVFQVLGKIIKFRPVSKAKKPQVQAATAEHHEAQPFLGSDTEDLRLSMDEHMTMQSDFPAPSEGHDYETDPAGESSSRSSRTPGAVVSHDSGSKAATKGEEETFELKQRVNTFPKDAEGNILPMHNAR